MKSEKITLEFAPSQVEELVNKLSIEDKIRLVRKLENETWARRLDKVVGQIRSRFRKNPISDKEITKICEEARQQIYNERITRRN